MKVLPMYRLFLVCRSQGDFRCSVKRRKKEGIESESGASKEMKEEREREGKETLFIFHVAMGFHRKPQSFLWLLYSQKNKKSELTRGP